MRKEITTFQFRIYPTIEQQTLIEKSFGCRRFVWNWYVEHYSKDISVKLSDIKKEFTFLKEVDSLALTNTWCDFIQACRNRRNNPKHFKPLKFHSKKNSKQSYATNNQKGSVRVIDSKHIKLPKLGIMKIKFHRQIPNNYIIKKCTISRNCVNQYYIAISCEYINDNITKELDLNKSIGLDYSLPYFYVDSQNQKPGYPHYFYVSEKRLAKKQKKLSKKTLNSNNYNKQKLKVAKIHLHISNQRKDFCHKLSKQLIDTYDFIFVEDINLQHQAIHKKWGKKTNDNGFGMFRLFLEYKALKYDKVFLKVDKWFASSKICNECGAINSKLTLKDREWICPACGAIIDRDYNAAKNIRDQGIKFILSNQ